MNALWKICSLVVNGQSFLVIDGYLIILFSFKNLCWCISLSSRMYYLLHIHFLSKLPKDNALEVCGLLTPLHIVPEWYFLCQYAMLKAVPNKNAGFIILLTSIFIFLFFGEIRNLTTLCLLNNNGFSLSSFFSLSLSILKSYLWNLLLI